MIINGLKSMGIDISGDRISISDDYISTSKGICFCHTMRQDRLLSLQKIFGTERVIFSPDPIMLIKDDRSDKSDGGVNNKVSDLIIVHSNMEDCDNIQLNRIITHMSRRYKSHQYILQNELGEFSPNSKFIIGVGIDRIAMGLILKSKKPFCVINPKFGSYISFLSVLGLDTCVIHTTEYPVLKDFFVEIYNNTSSIELACQNAHNEMNNLSSWVNLYVCNIPDKFKHNGNSKLHIPGCSSFYKDASSMSHVSGIYLETNIYESLVEKQFVHLYPWIGILEDDDIDKLEDLFSKPQFYVSLLFCKAIFCYSTNILILLVSRLSFMRHTNEIIVRNIHMSEDINDGDNLSPAKIIDIIESCL